MAKPFKHRAQNLNANKPLIYTAMSKHLFYYRMHVSKFVLENGGVPLNPFMIFDYFLLDSVSRDLVVEGNNNLVKRADELWVFGIVSNGVLAEIELAKKMKKPIKYFKVDYLTKKIKKCNINEVDLEEDVKSYKNKLR